MYRNSVQLFQSSECQLREAGQSVVNMQRQLTDKWVQAENNAERYSEIASIYHGLYRDLCRTEGELYSVGHQGAADEIRDKVNTLTAQLATVTAERDANSFPGIAAKITAHYGERCEHESQGCPCCEAWAKFDGFVAFVDGMRKENGEA